MMSGLLPAVAERQEALSAMLTVLLPVAAVLQPA